MAVPEEQDPSNLIALGMREIKGKNLDNGVLFLTKAMSYLNNIAPKYLYYGTFVTEYFINLFFYRPLKCVQPIQML